MSVHGIARFSTVENLYVYIRRKPMSKHDVKETRVKESFRGFDTRSMKFESMTNAYFQESNP